jgi:hypothetical protein
MTVRKASAKAKAKTGDGGFVRCVAELQLERQVQKQERENAGVFRFAQDDGEKQAEARTGDSGFVRCAQNDNSKRLERVGLDGFVDLEGVDAVGEVGFGGVEGGGAGG